MQAQPMSYYQNFPIVEVAVNDWYNDNYLEDYDLKAVKTYKWQLKNNRYDPIVIYDDYVVDGCHRLIAAHQLGLTKIKAHVGL